MCTRGFYFEPQDVNLPILRFSFRDMARLPVAELFEHFEATIYLTFETKSVVEMKIHGVDHPYVTKQTNSNALDNHTPPKKYIFTLLYSKIEDFLKNVQPIWELAHQKNVLNKVDEEMLLAPVLKPRLTDQFDTR